MTNKPQPLPRTVNGMRLKAIELTGEIEAALADARKVMHNDPREAEIHLLWAEKRSMTIREILKDMPVQAQKGHDNDHDA